MVSVLIMEVSVVKPSLTLSPTQDQYVFIHDAVLESLTCGNTQIPASGLAGAIEKLKQKDSETGRTGFETQFHVCVSCLCIAVFIIHYHKGIESTLKGRCGCSQQEITRA